MVKRDKRNIGKLVRVIPHGTVVDNRIVRISFFRGDQKPGVPFVMVYDLTSKGSYPMPGDKLELVLNK